ncbi:MAG TPA: DUF1073 domain-containing protein [Williamwhitmania sp.]|nr:DUF1073 domain-containing protein [Williamwhitmania sp.]
MKNKTKKNADNWINVATGVGVRGIDKTIGAYALWDRTPKMIAENLYASDDISGILVDAIPDDAVKEGISWKIADDDKQWANDTIKALNNEFDRLNVWEVFNWAWKLARIQGGSAVFISVDDSAALDTPLNLNMIRKINALHVFDRWDLDVMSLDMEANLASPNYGKPNYYTYNSSGSTTPDATMYRIHYTRIIRFDGIKLPNNLFIANGYWDDSIFGRLMKPISSYGQSNDSIVTILSEFNQAVFKLDGMTEAISQDESELVVNKLNFVNLMRSSLRAIVLDKEDEFDNKQAAVGGVKDIYGIVKDRLIAASGIPHSRLMGESPGSSLGETGNSQLVDYYDKVAREQSMMLRGPIDRLTTLLFRQSKNQILEPDNWTYKFNPLYSESQETIINTRLAQANIDNIYMTQGVYDSVEVAKSRFGSGEYSFETDLDDDELGLDGETDENDEA